MSPYEHEVLGGIRAINDTIDAEPVPAPAWTWHNIAVLGAVAFVLGVIVWQTVVAS